nr:ATP-binding protein [uncultured Desulfobulbus sp.]
MKHRLLWKLLFINSVPVILVILVVIWWAIDHLAATYFMDLMKRYAIEPTEIHSMFVSSIHLSLLWASLVALLVAVGLSFLLTRRILRPLTQMAQVSDRIALGDFSPRLEVATRDELGDLSQALNHMADSLAQVEQLRKNMVADLAHELRTPLTNLCGYLEGLRDQVLSPTTETLTMLHLESLHLLRLVENLQQLARADAAEVVLNRGHLDPVRELHQLLALYRPLFAGRGIQLHEEYTVSTELYADREKLLQVLRNLLENCLHYTPNKGWVALSLREQNDHLLFSFTNSGPGIAPEDLPFIFERFFRTDRSRTRQGSGFGIGLAICKQLVAAQGGEIGAESEPGQTRIWFLLPLV